MDGPEISNITIRVDEQWNEAFWLVEGNLPLDLTGKTIELYIRPRFDHATLIRKLTSAAGVDPGCGEIIIDNATKGAAHIFVTAANVTAGIPVGVWDYFMRVVNTSDDIKEWRRGTLTVRPGRTTS